MAVGAGAELQAVGGVGAHGLGVLLVEGAVAAVAGGALSDAGVGDFVAEGGGVVAGVALGVVVEGDAAGTGVACTVAVSGAADEFVGGDDSGGVDTDAINVGVDLRVLGDGGLFLFEAGVGAL